MNKRPSRSFAIIVSLLTALIILAACGPAPEAALNNPSAASASPQPAATGSSRPNSLNGLGANLNAGSSGTTATGSVIGNPDTAAVDANGIPVGFTQEGRPYRGQLNAPVFIEEFTDYQCPFCARYFMETAPSIDQNQIANGDALLVLFDFPLSIHPQAPAAANAARCAGEEGAIAYWAMHDKLFESVSQWSVNDPMPIFNSLAASLSLDKASFDACIQSNRYDTAVKTDVQIGTQRGVSGTPTFFINGQAVVGSQPVSVFDRAIAAAKSGEPLVQDAGPTPAPVTEADVDQYMPTPATVSDNFAGALGDPDAPVKIAEFTDYQCPFCARHSQDTLPRILSDMIDTGRVYYAMYDMPLDSLHPNARLASTVARCAGDQNQYWAMHDLLFGRQDEWTGQDASWFNTLAEELSLDTAAFSQCVASGRFDSIIQASLDEAAQLGLQGTPSFFVNGYRVFNGAQPFDVFEQVVRLAEKDQLDDAIRAAIRQQLTAQRVQETQQQIPETPREPADVPIPADAIALGDPNAKIVLVEYTDYQCPFCARHHAQTYPQILSEYVDKGLVRYVIKDFPLESIHPQANLASQSAHCAGDQDAYFEMHGVLFERQEQWGNDKAADYFTQYAGELGLNTDTFAQCLSSGKYAALVSSQIDEGIGFNIDGTPGFFLNGQYIYGAQPFSVFKQAIDSLLQAQP